jgi:hypothetical protein
VPRSRHMPSEQLTTRSTAEDQDVEVFWFSHGVLPCL